VNIQCQCISQNCVATIQIGDPDRSISPGWIPLRLFGVPSDGVPTVWLDKENLDRLIAGLQEAREKVR
jgi:hypothetical protein